MSRPKFFYDLVTRMWPLNRLFLRLGRQPFIGGPVRAWLNTNNHTAIMIPVNETVPVGKSSPLPITLLDPLVSQAGACFLMEKCLCRTSDNCQDYPHDLGCLFLGEGAAQINSSLGRSIQPDEARLHVQRALDLGLLPMIVHTTFDSHLFGIPYRRMLTVCFCCDCCCAVRNGMREGPQEFLDILVRLPGLEVQVGEDCLGCGACLPVCDVHAISLNGDRAEISDSCKGCGRCADACPAGAIQISLTGQNMLDLLMGQINQRTNIHPTGKAPSQVYSSAD